MTDATIIDHFHITDPLQAAATVTLTTPREFHGRATMSGLFHVQFSRL